MNAEAPPTRTRVATDLLCVVCGYNLRGANPAGACPECGATVERSINGWRLENAPSRWLAQVRLGLWMMVPAPAQLFANDVCLLLPFRMRPFQNSLLWGDLTFVTRALRLMLFAGVLLATSCPPGQRPYAAKAWLRRSVQIGFCVWSVVNAILDWYRLPLAPRNLPALHLPLLCLDIVLGVVVVTAWVPLFLVLRNDARRLPSRLLVHAAGLSMIVAAFHALAVLGWWIGNGLVAWPPSRWDTLAMWAPWVAERSDVLRTAASVFVFVGLALALRRPLRHARDLDHAVSR